MTMRDISIGPLKREGKFCRREIPWY